MRKTFLAGARLLHVVQAESPVSLPAKKFKTTKYQPNQNVCHQYALGFKFSQNTFVFLFEMTTPFPGSRPSPRHCQSGAWGFGSRARQDKTRQKLHQNLASAVWHLSVNGLM